MPTSADSARNAATAAAVLQSFADEEAAKVMILLDLARCGWRDQVTVQECLGRFYRHLARGLYIRAYEGNPADLAEVKRHLDVARQQYHLDGPLDVDWIFGNEVTTAREERLYVDYIEDEHGQRRWTGPAAVSAIEAAPFSFAPPASQIVKVVSALHRLGVLTEAGLEATRSAWHNAAVTTTMRWEAVSELNLGTLARLSRTTGREYEEAEFKDVAFVSERWTFPLYDLDLSEAPVELEDLRRVRHRRLARDFGIDDEWGQVE